jgi:hypothetical protein
MPRIRTVKPELGKHEGLFEAEQETGFPLRFTWAMFPTACDREGRFRWRPRALKSDILPYDDLDFARVLDALLTRAYLLKYRVGHEWYGAIPTFSKHQVINNRESESSLPSVVGADEVIDYRSTTSTRDERVDHASATPLRQVQGERKGREGKEEGNDASSVKGAPRKDLWFRQLVAAYPAERRSAGHVTERAFFDAFEDDDRPAEIVFDAMLAALEQAKRSEQWLTGRIPLLENWLLKQLYIQRHDATIARPNDPGAPMRERTARLLHAGPSASSAVAS